MEEEFSLSFLLSASTARYFCKFCDIFFQNTTQLVCHQNEEHSEQLLRRPQLGINSGQKINSNKRKRDNPSTSFSLTKSHNNKFQSSSGSSSSSSQLNKNNEFCSNLNHPTCDDDDDLDEDVDGEEEEDIRLNKSDKCDNYLNDYTEHEDYTCYSSPAVVVKIKQEEQEEDTTMDHDHEDMDIQMETYLQCKNCGTKFLTHQSLETHLSLDCPVIKLNTLKQEPQLVVAGGSTGTVSSQQLSSKPLKKRARIQKVNEEGDEQQQQQRSPVDNVVDHNQSNTVFKAVAAAAVAARKSISDNNIASSSSSSSSASTSSSSKFPIKLNPKPPTPVSILSLDPTKIPAPLMYRLLPKTFADSLIESLF